jgi:hypothetical protein
MNFQNDSELNSTTVIKFHPAYSKIQIKDTQIDWDLVNYTYQLWIILYLFSNRAY